MLMTILNETDIYYLKSTLRSVETLIELVENEADFMPSIGYEVLCDNRNWLTDRIDELEKEHASTTTEAGPEREEVGRQVRNDCGEAGSAGSDGS